MSPLKRLREFFGQHPDLVQLSTQTGLARLVGRSESLVRSIEQNRAPMNSKLARLLSELVGVKQSWLMEESVKEDDAIPMVDGGELDNAEVYNRIAGRIKSNFDKLGSDRAPDIKRSAIEAILSLVEAEIQGDLDESGDAIPSILEWLKSRAEARAKKRAERQE